MKNIYRIFTVLVIGIKCHATSLSLEDKSTHNNSLRLTSEEITRLDEFMLSPNRHLSPINSVFISDDGQKEEYKLDLTCSVIERAIQPFSKRLPKLDNYYLEKLSALETAFTVYTYSFNRKCRDTYDGHVLSEFNDLRHYHTSIDPYYQVFQKITDAVFRVFINYGKLSAHTEAGRYS